MMCPKCGTTHTDDPVHICDGPGCRGPSYKGSSIVEMFRRASVRCGKPITAATPIEPRCAECAADLERASHDPRTVLGMLIAARKKNN